MSDFSGQTSGNGAEQEELLRAMIGRVNDLGKSVKDNLDQTGKLVEHLEAVRGVNERMTGQEKRLEELVLQEQRVIDEIRQVAEKIDLPAEKIGLLQKDLKDHRQLFEKPLDKTVRYHHFVGKAVWVLAALVLITVCAVALAVGQWLRADRYAIDEIRWRFIKLSLDTAVTKVADRAEQRGLEDPRQLTRDVEEEEHRRAELAKNLLREHETLKRIDELQRQKGLK